MPQMRGPLSLFLAPSTQHAQRTWYQSSRASSRMVPSAVSASAVFRHPRALAQKIAHGTQGASINHELDAAPLHSSFPRFNSGISSVTTNSEARMDCLNHIYSVTRRSRPDPRREQQWHTSTCLVSAHSSFLLRYCLFRYSADAHTYPVWQRSNAGTNYCLSLSTPLRRNIDADACYLLTIALSCVGH
ncbi:hypothetical protein IWZ01DRAFT_16681 [Phyllosticta capitalensis]